MDKDNKMNYTFFSVKALACFCVIMVHCSFLGNIGEILKAFSRWAVPFFFMLSGYFSNYHNYDILNTKINQRLKKIIKLIIIAFLVYFIVNIAINYIKGSLDTILNNITNWNYILKLVFLNWTTPFIGVGHLWFLLADVYVYIIFKFIAKINKYRYAYLYSVICMIVIYLFQIFSIVFDYSFEEIYIRNAFLFAFPLFMLGHFIGKNKDKFFLVNKKKTISALILLYSFTIIFEILIFNGKFEFYLNNIIFNILIFVIALNYPNIKIGWKIGKNHSANIYIIHYLIIIIFNLINIPILNKLFYYIAPFVVFLLSLMISSITIKIKKYGNI